jgi:hypothetical protein
LDLIFIERYRYCMGFVARACGLLGSLSLAVGCGQVTRATGGDGALPNDSAAGGSASTSDLFSLPKSGERVLALGYLSEGVAQFHTLHDRLLDFDCEFVDGEVGADHHCLPKHATTLIFLDATCSQPATWLLDRSLQAGEWVSVGAAPGTASAMTPPEGEVFELAEEVYPESNLVSESQVYELQGAACVRAFPPAKSLPAVHRLIAHAQSELATAKLLNVDVGGGLRLSRLIGADGLELTAGVSTADGAVCTVQPSGEFVVTSADGTAPVPATQRVVLGSLAVHVELITSSASGGGAGVPVARYPAATDFLDDAGDRCSATKAVDGTLRCSRVALGAYESDRWSDAACTERLYYSDWPGTDFAKLRAPVVASDGSLAAVATVKAYEGPVYTVDAGGCVPMQYVPDSLVQLDQRVDISTMPEVFETTL